MRLEAAAGPEFAVSKVLIRRNRPATFTPRPARNLIDRRGRLSQTFLIERSPMSRGCRVCRQTNTDVAC